MGVVGVWEALRVVSRTEVQREGGVWAGVAALSAQLVGTSESVLRLWVGSLGRVTVKVP